MGLTILPIRTRSIGVGAKCLKSKCATTIQTAETRQHSTMVFPQESFLMPSLDKTEPIILTKNKKML